MPQTPAKSPVSVLWNRIDELKDNARKLFLGDGYHAHIAIISSDMGRAVAYTLVNSEAKAEFSNKLQAGIKAGVVTEIVHISECWIARRSASQVQEAIKIAVRNLPDKEEILMVQYSSAQREIMYSADIIRDHEDHPALGPWQEFDMHKENKGNLDSLYNTNFGSLFPRAQAGAN